MAMARIDKKTGKVLSVWNPEMLDEDWWVDVSDLENGKYPGEGLRRVMPDAEDDEETEVVTIPGKKRSEVHEEMEQITSGASEVDVILEGSDKRLRGKNKPSRAQKRGKKDSDYVTFADLEAIQREQE